jgi:CNT family concentrative nucleoside transporter
MGNDILRGVIGISSLILIAFIFSNNKRKIDWLLVAKGIGLQIVFALLVLKVEFVRIAFNGASQFFVKVLDFSSAGSDFVLGRWPEVAQIQDGISGSAFTVGYIFAFKVLPTIIFFSALTSLLYYLGILQIIIYAIAWVMKRTMRLSGAESLGAAANIFIGQTEAPLVVKPYLAGMTKSELLALMTGGMATIAGGVLAAYIGFLGGEDAASKQAFATHLLTASILSAPASLVIAKILFPQTDNSVLDKDLHVPKEKIGSNVLDAVSNGTRDGLKLAVNVGAMLLVFTAFMFMFNYIFKDIIGELTGLNSIISNNTSGRYAGLTLQYVFGLVFSPLAWLIGVAKEDMVLIGQLLGEKTILNEFFAYASLGTLKAEGMFHSEKSIIIATYALCGFSNFASIGIQIGGISALAPSQQHNLASLGIKALIGGSLACFMTAAIAGMLIGG